MPQLRQLSLIDSGLANGQIRDLSKKLGYFCFVARDCEKRRMTIAVDQVNNGHQIRKIGHRLVRIDVVMVPLWTISYG